MTGLDLHLDLAASLAAAASRQDAAGAVKVWEDLDRYERIIKATRPEVIVECGTWRGGSTAWFADHGVDVITIDVIPFTAPAADRPITVVTGSSTDPRVAGHVAGLVDGRRTMVCLDSDHRSEHVIKEIVWYGPLVTCGCYLVVEDGITRFVPTDPPGPLDAIEAMLAWDARWERDEEIEKLHPVTMSPAGWWRRVG